MSDRDVVETSVEVTHDAEDGLGGSYALDEDAGVRWRGRRERRELFRRASPFSSRGPFGRTILRTRRDTYGQRLRAVGVVRLPLGFASGGGPSPVAAAPIASSEDQRRKPRLTER